MKMLRHLLLAFACVGHAAAPALAKERPEGAKRDALSPAEAAVLAGICAGRVDDGSDALAQLDAIGAVRPQVEEAVAAALRGRDPKCRPWAALALGRLHPWRALPALPMLQQALANDDTLVRLEVYETLRRMGPLARPAIAAIEKAAGTEIEPLRPFAATALEHARQVAQPTQRPFGLRLMALGRREAVPVAYMLDEDGSVREVRGGEQFLDGTIARVSDDAVEFDGRRVTGDFAVLPHRARLRLFEGGAPPPIPVASEYTGAPVSIDFAGDLGGFAAFMAEYGPLNVIVEGGGSPSVRVAALQTPWDAVVDHALEEAGVARRVESLYVRLGRPEQLDRHPRLPSRKFEGSLVSLKFRDAEMETMAYVFGDVSQLKIELPPGPHDKLTVYFTDVPWDEALEMIAASRGWTTAREGDRVVVTKAGP